MSFLGSQGEAPFFVFVFCFVLQGRFWASVCKDIGQRPSARSGAEERPHGGFDGEPAAGTVLDLQPRGFLWERRGKGPESRLQASRQCCVWDQTDTRKWLSVISHALVEFLDILVELVRMGSKAYSSTV